MAEEVFDMAHLSAISLFGKDFVLYLRTELFIYSNLQLCIGLFL